LPHRHLRPQWETRGNPAIEFAQASEPTTDQEAVGDVTPNPNRGDGGKAATGRIIRQLQTERLKALKAKPKTGDPVQDWLDGPSILGEWGGYRQRLEDRGITFGGFSANAFLTNATGGNRRSWAYTNLTMAAADLEFERLVGLPGFLVHTEMAAAAGNNLSSRSRIGNLFNVATEYAPNGLYLSQMYAQQQLFDDVLTLQLGRLTTNNFATLPVFADYVSVAGNGTPTALPLGSTYFTFPPAVEWGAVTTARATDRIAVAAGVYNTNNSSALPQASRNGADFGLTFDNGVMMVAQLTYASPATDAIGLPGIYAFGGFYSSADYPRLRNGREKDGNYGFY
jgi:porin